MAERSPLDACSRRPEVIFADSIDTDNALDDLGSTSIDDVSRMIEAVEAEITTVLWGRVWGEPLYQSQAKALHSAVAQLSSWTELEGAAA